MDGELRVWSGNYGQYVMPKELHHIKFTKNGWFDRRRKLDYYKPLIAWLISVGETDYLGVNDGS